MHQQRRKRAVCSASAATPAEIVLLELPDAPAPDRPYDLRPSEVRQMPLHSASYRLVGVLFYAHKYHYIADVHDPFEERWVRYDANFNGGIGVAIQPPVGRARHEGCDYYPIALAYVRVVQ